MEKIWINVKVNEYEKFINWVNENKGGCSYLYWSVADAKVFFLDEDDECKNPICKAYYGGDPVSYVIWEEMYKEFKELQ